MIGFCGSENLPAYISTKMSLPTSNEGVSDKVISCKLKWGETNATVIQNEISSYAEIKDKTVYIFLVSDTVSNFAIPENVRLYRTSLYKSQQSENEHILPYIWENIAAPPPPLECGEMPVIGFCGLNSSFRRATLKAFQEDHNIECDFIIRKKFWGGRPHDPQLVSDFTANMVNSHFNICNRGAGNFSMRFYQTLSCGRIPVLLNTDMVLPLAEEIDWENLIVLSTTAKELPEKLLAYWNTKDVVEMQTKCKEVYDKHFLGTTFIDRVLSV